MRSTILVALAVSLWWPARHALAHQPEAVSFLKSEKASSRWAILAKNGRLEYQTTAKGDRIMDFSHAGYMGGGVALPLVPVAKTLTPSGGDDDTRSIQKAIDEVSAYPLKKGFRGAVLLAPGDFVCSGTIYLSTSGVVLRGSGSGVDGTTIRMVGDKHCAFVIGASKEAARPSAEGTPTDRSQRPGMSPKARPVRTMFADLYVPSGAMSFAVDDSRGFSVGDTIIIERPTTAAWIKFMQMDNLKRDGRAQTFLNVGRTGSIERRVRAINGNVISIDVPVSDSYDATYLNPPGTIVRKGNLSSPVLRIGVEQIHIQCPPLEIKYSDAPYSAIRVSGHDCWVKDVCCEETMNSTVITGRRVTIQQVVVKHTYPNLGASKPADFSIQGCQILIDRCRASGGNTYFVWTGSLQAGPNVVLNSSFSGYGSRLQPHQRWATGLLFDNCRIPDGGLDFMNRGVAGSGHGWTMGWGVAWNCVAKTYIIQNPPGTLNWAIGCIGSRQRTPRLFDTAPILPEGEFDSFGTHVAPQSLYLAQLEQRLGPQALRKIGYGPNREEEFQLPCVIPASEVVRDLDPEFGADLAMHRPVNASNVRGNKREYGAEKALDGNAETYWAIDDGTVQATFEVDMEGPVDLNVAEICEAHGFEGRILEYRIEGQVDSDWKLMSHGTAVGGRKVDRFPKDTVWKIRLTVMKWTQAPALMKFGLYLK